ncbi:helix-turn-helix domain-containing protein [Marinimicrobium locisalis]|uniref:helix-turn-helix domain-containing protein n=1 Tax=Marinimicrobium locisalis TaxID=546022 RepID=UPI003221C1E3
MESATFSHNAVIFNINDLVLLMAAGQCLVLAILLILAKQSASRSNQLLGAFLVVKAIQSLDMLVIWSEHLRTLVLQTHPDLLFTGTILSLLQGPLLYWYVASVLYRSFRFRWLDLLHLIPVLVAGIVITWNYYWLPETEQVRAMTHLEFMWSAVMRDLTTLWHFSVISYGIWSLVAITRYRELLKQRYANVEVRKKSWLKGIVIAMITIAAWRLGVHLLGESIGFARADMLGVVGNYIELIFVNVLVFTSIRYVHLFDRVDEPAQEPALARGYKDEQVSRVSRLMREQKPYLQQDITIETLSRKASIPERTLSRILNQHFEKNFFEFVNSYRIEEAKQLLSDPQQSGKTILELMNDAGFTSKSTFNTLFKKHVGQTPSQFRKSQGQSSASTA